MSMILPQNPWRPESKTFLDNLGTEARPSIAREAKDGGGTKPSVSHIAAASFEWV